MHFLCFVVIAVSAPLTESALGMTVLKTLYGAECKPTRTLTRMRQNLDSYVKRMCDGKDVCVGLVHRGIVRKKPGCRGSINIVYLCFNGELGSWNIRAATRLKLITINCSNNTVPSSRLKFADWMSQMEREVSRKYIKELRLAGSHQTGSYGFAQNLNAPRKFQRHGVGLQLLSGVRYIDYRFEILNTDFEIKWYNRGSNWKYTLQETQNIVGDLLEIWAFTTLYPREFFIVHFRETSILSKGFQKQFRIWLDMLFRGIAIRRDTIDVTQHTLQDVWKSEKRIIFIQDRPLSTILWNPNVLYTEASSICSGEGLLNYTDDFARRLNKHGDQISMLQWIVTKNETCPSTYYTRTQTSKHDLYLWLFDYYFPFSIVLCDFTLDPLDGLAVVDVMVHANKIFHHGFEPALAIMKNRFY